MTDPKRVLRELQIGCNPHAADIPRVLGLYGERVLGAYMAAPAKGRRYRIGRGYVTTSELKAIARALNAGLGRPFEVGR